MKTIYKYELDAYINDIELPINSVVLSAEKQKNSIYIWVMVDTKKPIETRKFLNAYTGDNLLDFEDNELKFINTIIDGGLVYHIFEVI